MDDYWRLWNTVSLVLICHLFAYRTIRDMQKHPHLDRETVWWRWICLAMLGNYAAISGVNLHLDTPAYFYVKVIAALNLAGLIVLLRPWNTAKGLKSIRQLAADRRKPPPSDYS